MVASEPLTTADVVVVGAGIAGMCTAFELRKRGFDVAVLEQRFAAFGGSGRNPGAVWLQLQRGGIELDLARAGAALYDEYDAEIGGGFDHRAMGGLFFYETDEQREILADYVADRRAHGLEIDFVSRKEALGYAPLLPSTAIGAVYCAEDRQVDPQRFVRGLAMACTEAGVKRFDNTAVLSTIRRGDAVIGVRTTRGDVYSGGVVWATGAWARDLDPEGIYVPLTTSRMGQIVTQPLDQRPSVIMHGPRGVAACGALKDLPSFRPEAFAPPNPLPGVDGLAVEDWDYDDCITHYRDGSLHIGCSVDITGSLNPHISIRATQAMITTTADRYAAYGKFGVTSLWAGLQSNTPDLLPVVDRVDGTYLNVGHTSGMATGPIAGRVLARIIAGEQDEFAEYLRADRSSLTVVGLGPGEAER
ncbi:FAD-binding oxidoreductase [uncultured Mycolicibacterium sp.]|uniref:NAD(P)/FAD-dependent oxidoreductase n=1 Tax=uncultured Mycolicibacterium sp. TaxID=2320817 RepID=UPI00262936F8|nr:FAD-dependent oxidoreductase [uncultured Mycolicibacterium sp.]